MISFNIDWLTYATIFYTKTTHLRVILEVNEDLIFYERTHFSAFFFKAEKINIRNKTKIMMISYERERHNRI